MECAVTDVGGHCKWFFISKNGSEKQIFPLGACRHVRFTAHSRCGGQHFKQVSNNNYRWGWFSAHFTHRLWGELFSDSFFFYPSGIRGKTFCSLTRTTVIRKFSVNNHAGWWPKRWWRCSKEIRPKQILRTMSSICRKTSITAWRKIYASRSVLNTQVRVYIIIIMNLSKNIFICRNATNDFGNAVVKSFNEIKRSLFV